MRRPNPIALLISCGLVLISAIAIGTAMMVFHYRDRALSSNERELKNTALILAEHSDRAFQALDLVQRSVVERMQALNIASSEDYQRQMSGHDVHLMLKDKIGGLPHVEAIQLFNSEGQLINLSRFWPIPALSIADRDHFKALKADPQLTSVVSAPVFNRITDTWTVYLVRKFTGPNGEFLGTVNGGLNIKHFEQFFGSIALGPDSAISLFRRDGVLLARYPQRDALGTSYAKGPLFTKVLSHSNQGVVRLTSIVDGKERLIAGHSLDHYPVVVAVGTTVSAALADWREETKFLIGMALLAALVIGTILFFIVRQLSLRHKQSERALNDQKLQLDTALSNMRQGLQMYDAKGRVILTNQKYMKTYGLPPDAEKLGWTIRDVLHLRKAAGTLAGDPDQYLAKMIDRGKVETKVVQLPDGRTISVTNAPVPDGGWVSTHEDITESKRREASFRLLFESNPLPMWVFDVDTLRFLAVNDAAVAHYGFSREQFLAMSVSDIRPIEDRERLVQFVRNSAGLQQGEEIWRHRKAGGSEIEVAVYSRALQYDGRAAVLVAIRDVTEQRRAEMERARSEERIVHLAQHDALTDLPNRVLFCEELDRALARVQRGDRVALLSLDLDRFKDVNDTYGHLLGDELLKAVADRLRGCVRETDLVARLGGDEFSVLQTSLEHSSDPAALATRIIDALKAPLHIGGHEVEIGVSVGISVAPNDAIERGQMLKYADLALYGAKSSGRGTYCFYEPEMDARVKARRALEFDLRQAIMCGEFELHYQPLVSLRDNKITGCEALLRWCHPKRGMISPAEFIPLAEESGLINPLGEWVLRTACTQAATWPDGIKIAVNVSPVQFKSGNLVQLVVNILATSRLPASRLELEITEAVLIRDDEAALAVLHQLRKLGVRIAMDDFGTGYSSLSYLHRFPFDKIKIDRSFIKDVTEKNGSHSIVQAVVSIARSQNITTVAEGVETEEQMELLRSLGCTEMQGYLFSRAIPASEISRLISACRDSAAAVA
jgi:diguanylate cyclase (GGDEF)-like protein/PAS domain S-box-containing protein